MMLGVRKKLKLACDGQSTAVVAKAGTCRKVKFTPKSYCLAAADDIVYDTHNATKDTFTDSRYKHAMPQ